MDPRSTEVPLLMGATWSSSPSAPPLARSRHARLPPRGLLPLATGDLAPSWAKWGRKMLLLGKKDALLEVVVAQGRLPQTLEGEAQVEVESGPHLTQLSLGQRPWKTTPPDTQGPDPNWGLRLWAPSPTPPPASHGGPRGCAGTKSRQRIARFEAARSTDWASPHEGASKNRPQPHKGRPRQENPPHRLAGGGNTSSTHSSGGRGWVGLHPGALTVQLLIHNSQALFKGSSSLQQGLLRLVVVIDVQVGAANGGPSPLHLSVVGQGTGQLQVVLLVLGRRGTVAVTNPCLKQTPRVTQLRGVPMLTQESPLLPGTPLPLSQGLPVGTLAPQPSKRQAGGGTRREG